MQGRVLSAPCLSLNTLFAWFRVTSGKLCGWISSTLRLLRFFLRLDLFFMPKFWASCVRIHASWLLSLFSGGLHFPVLSCDAVSFIPTAVNGIYIFVTAEYRVLNPLCWHLPSCCYPQPSIFSLLLGTSQLLRPWHRANLDNCLPHILHQQIKMYTVELDSCWICHMKQF